MSNLKFYTEKYSQLDNFFQNYPLTGWEIICLIRDGEKANNINRVLSLVKVSSPSKFCEMYCEVVDHLEIIAGDEGVTRGEMLKTYLGID